MCLALFTTSFIMFGVTIYVGYYGQQNQHIDLQNSALCNNYCKNILNNLNLTGPQIMLNESLMNLDVQRIQFMSSIKDQTEFPGTLSYQINRYNTASYVNLNKSISKTMLAGEKFYSIPITNDISGQLQVTGLAARFNNQDLVFTNGISVAQGEGILEAVSAVNISYFKVNPSVIINESQRLVVDAVVYFNEAGFSGTFMQYNPYWAYQVMFSGYFFMSLCAAILICMICGSKQSNVQCSNCKDDWKQAGCWCD